MEFNFWTKLKTVVALAVTLPFVSQAQNPIVQTNYTADPAPMVHNGTVYLYTSHDEDVTVKNFFTMNDWLCYSSTDMVNWTDHGVVLSYKDFEWSRGDAWAGQCIYRNGKFYYYLPVNQKNGGNAIGVAVSDSPTGPFKDALGAPLLVGYGYIDPTVYIDDDGQAYLYWGNPNLWHVKLNEDMISYDKSYGIVKEDLKDENFGYRSKKIDNRTAAYEEGPWLFKRNSLYYMLYPAGGVPEHLAYSTSKSITGPWTYGDTIMHVIKNKGAFTNHPGYIEYKGNIKLQTLSAQIGWSHNVSIFQNCKDNLGREFYMKMTIKFGWTYRVLEHQMESKSYEKYLINQTNFDSTITEKYKYQALLSIKDEYNFDFLEDRKSVV